MDYSFTPFNISSVLIVSVFCHNLIIFEPLKTLILKKKSGKSSQKRAFSIVFAKMAQWIFLILCQNVELNSVIQPVETICEKIFVQKLIQVKDTLRLIVERCRECGESCL